MLGELGFVLHTITEAKKRAFRTMIFNNTIYEGRHHIQQVDAVYIKDFQTFSALPLEKLIRLGALMHYCYASWDVAHLALQRGDEQKLAQRTQIHD